MSIKRDELEMLMDEYHAEEKQSMKILKNRIFELLDTHSKEFFHSDEIIAKVKFPDFFKKEKQYRKTYLVLYILVGFIKEGRISRIGYRWCKDWFGVVKK